MRRGFDEYESDEGITGEDSPVPTISQEQQDRIFEADLELIKSKTKTHQAIANLLNTVADAITEIVKKQLEG
jgi:hypothetical protein